MINISQAGMDKLVRWLVVIFIILFVLNAFVIAITYFTGHGSFFGVLELFDFYVEGNIPTYLSSIVFLLSSFLLYSIYRLHKQRRMTNTIYWLVLSIGFLYLSIDDFVQLHELSTPPMRALLGTEGIFYYASVIPCAIISLLLVVFFAKFFFDLPSRFKVLFGIAALSFLGGAVGVDMFEGAFATADESFSLTFMTLVAVEQSLQYVGQLIFLYGVVDYMKTSPQIVSTHQHEVEITARGMKSSAEAVVQSKID